MADFLDVEIEQIDQAAQDKTTSELNEWFDKSAIKARFKKACMSGQGLRCCYCRKFFELPYNNIWDLEHVLSEELYPQFFTTAGNLAVACKRCNTVKKEKDVLRLDYPRPPAELPNQVADYTIPHPLLTPWEDHLTHANFMVYRPKSKLGEELINVCKLNGPALEEAGLTVEMVETAIAENFFATMGPIIPTSLDATTAVTLSGDLVLAQENLRRDAMLASLNKALDRLEKHIRKAAAKGQEPD